MPGREGVAEGEYPLYIADASLRIQAGLAAGAAQADQIPGPELRMQGLGQLRRNHLRLVVPSVPLSPPVERDGKHRVDIGKMPLPGHVRAQPGGEKTACLDVARVLERPRDVLVRVLVVVEQQRGGVGVLHGLSLRPLPLQQGVELVRHGVVRLLPVAGFR